MKEFKITAKTIKTDRTSFIVCKAKIKDIWYKVKFRKECENVPKRNGMYVVKAEDYNLSVQRGAEYVDKKTGEIQKLSNILWVAQCELREFTPEEYYELTSRQLESVFGND